MGFFDFIGNIFKPASDLVDELHFSGEERANAELKKAELQNKLAEIQAKVNTKLMELQSKSIDANAKVAIAEQQHGNMLSKSWRPITSLCLIGMVIAMGFEVIPYKELIIKFAFGFCGIYGAGRSYEKKK